MSKKSLVLEQYQQLDEQLLSSEFTFGFELEAILSYDSELHTEVSDRRRPLTGIKEHIDNLLYSDMPEKYVKQLKGESDIVEDGSVHQTSHDYDEPDIEFEYSSPIIPLTPMWLGKVVKTLQTLLDEGVYTNKSCGFHHHLSFGNIHEKDMVWIYCNLAADPSTYKDFVEFQGHSFQSSQYASYYDLDELATALLNDDFDTVGDLLTTTKYRTFRIHPQGTLEWRGPRNFLNDKNVEVIKEFYRLFLKMSQKISHYMKSNTIEGTTITKEKLFRNLDMYKQEKNIGDRDLEYIQSTGHETIKLKSNKKAKLSSEAIDKLIKLFNKDIGTLIDMVIKRPNVLETFFKHFDASMHKDLINQLLQSKKWISLDYSDKEKIADFFATNCNIYSCIYTGMIRFVSTNMVTALSMKLVGSDTFGKVLKTFIDLGKISNISEIQKLIANFLSDERTIDLSIILDIYLKKDTLGDTLSSKTLAKLIVFHLKYLINNGCSHIYFNYADGNVIKEVIRDGGMESSWDSLIKIVCSTNGDAFRLLINEPTIKELLTLVHEDDMAYNRMPQKYRDMIKQYMGK